ncbi:MAG: threonine aldolase family protein [Candidatus Hodarchaeota archaeon]
MNEHIIDLRSDTVTKPSPEMWEAFKSLNNSKIGDDVFKEDPTVNALEEKAAKLMNKEAALLVTSGTQGNLVSLLSSTTPGQEILLEAESHIFWYEVGGCARIAGLTPRVYKTKKGFPRSDELRKLIRVRNDDHQPWTTLLCIENTHNRHGGTVCSPDILSDLYKFTLENALKFHMDGARIFNAAISLNQPVNKFSKSVDSLTFCLSKGLSCPIGSLVVGSKDFITKARKYRKMLGGGMRQAGIIASMGLIALESKWIKRLEEDHKNAQLLADGLHGIPIPLKITIPESNIIFVEFPLNVNMNKLISSLEDEGILCLSTNNKVRFVTHYGITEEDIEDCIDKISSVLSKGFNS